MSKEELSKEIENLKKMITISNTEDSAFWEKVLSETEKEMEE